MARPGDLVTVRVTRSAPHYVLADSAVQEDSALPDGGEPSLYAVRRTRAGEAWAARERARTGPDDAHGHGPGTSAGAGDASATSVLLGMPLVRR